MLRQTWIYCRERLIEGSREENVNTYEEIAMSTYERIKYFMKKQSEMITPMARACLIDSCTESRCLVGWWSFPGEATKPFSIDFYRESRCSPGRRRGSKSICDWFLTGTSMSGRLAERHWRSISAAWPTVARKVDDRRPKQRIYLIDLLRMNSYGRQTPQMQG